MESFKTYRKKFGSFYETIKKYHDEAKQPHRGHGFDHDVTVAQLAVKIAPSVRVAEMAWCAAMLHSVDRVVGCNDVEFIEQSTRRLSRYLPDNYFNAMEVEDICQSALRHHELNQDDQSLVQQVLMDADRLANLMPGIMIRAGQFRPEIPAFEFEFLEGGRNPVATYYKPRSVLDNLRTIVVEYIPMLRMPEAKELGRKYEAELKASIESLEQSYEELGLVGISL